MAPLVVLAERAVKTGALLVELWSGRRRRGEVFQQVAARHGRGEAAAKGLEAVVDAEVDAADAQLAEVVRRVVHESAVRAVHRAAAWGAADAVAEERIAAQGAALDDVLRTNAPDRILDLHVVVVDGDGEVLDRGNHEADRPGVGLFRNQRRRATLQLVVLVG